MHDKFMINLSDIRGKANSQKSNLKACFDATAIKFNLVVQSYHLTFYILDNKFIVVGLYSNTAHQEYS